MLSSSIYAAENLDSVSLVNSENRRYVTLISKMEVPMVDVGDVIRSIVTPASNSDSLQYEARGVSIGQQWFRYLEIAPRHQAEAGIISEIVH